MVFFTRGSESSPDAVKAPLAAFLLLMAALATTACAPVENDFGIALQDVRAEATPAGLRIRARQDVRLSREARTALRHAVPLRIRIDVAVDAMGRWNAFDREPLVYEIRYLPLSEHYQLTGPGADGPRQTYPRLRHVVAALRDLEFTLADAPAVSGAIEVSLRSRLDRSGMPGPMQLPVLLSSQWKHDSGWVPDETGAGG